MEPCSIHGHIPHEKILTVVFSTNYSSICIEPPFYVSLSNYLLLCYLHRDCIHSIYQAVKRNKQILYVENKEKNYWTGKTETLAVIIFAKRIVVTV